MFHVRTLKLTVAATIAIVTPANAQNAPPEIKLGVGYSYLQIDTTRFTTVTDFFVTRSIDHIDDHDGSFDGYKMEGEIGGFFPHTLGDFRSSFAVRGFYAAYRNAETSRCTYDANRDCAFFPLFDPNPSRANLSGGFFSDWHTRTSRDALYYGGGLEMRFERGAVIAGSLKDAPSPLPAVSPFQFHVGLGARGLDRTTKLRSTDFGPTADPVALNETLDTAYYGGYTGFTVTRDFESGYRLSLSTDAGVYVADGTYNGRYTATSSLGGGAIAQTLVLDDTRPAFIGTLNLGLEKDVGWAVLGVFAEGEWISYAPAVRHNDTDLATPVSSLKSGSTIFDTIGRQNGTVLGETSALSYTVGGRISVPLR